MADTNETRYLCGARRGKVVLIDKGVVGKKFFDFSSGREIEGVDFSLADFTPLRGVWVISVINNLRDTRGSDILFNDIRGYIKQPGAYREAINLISKAGGYQGNRLVIKNIEEEWMQVIFLYGSSEAMNKAARRVVSTLNFDGPLEKV